MGVLKQLIILTILVMNVQCRKRRVRTRTKVDFFIRSLLTEQSLRTIDVESVTDEDFYPLDHVESPVDVDALPGSQQDNENQNGNHDSRTRDSPDNGLLVGSDGGGHMEEILQAMKDFGIVKVTRDNAAAVSYMLDVYQKLEETDNIPRAVGHRRIDVAVLRADTVRGLPAKENKIQDGHVFLTFNLSRISRHEVTKKAELRLRVDGNSDRNQKYRTKVRIFREGLKIADLKYTVRSQRESATGTDVVDLTPVLQTIIDGGYGDTLIEVKLRKKNNNNQRQRRTVDDIYRSDVKNAILVIFTRDKNFFRKMKDDRVEAVFNSENPPATAVKSRDRRASERRAQIGARKLCQKHDFEIKFADIGWDKWIVYPKRFNAYYCMGRCPTPVEKSYSPTNHAILQGLIRMGNTIIPRPCCVPTKLRPLSMLYYEYDEIVVRQHEDMIASECGCR